MKQSTAKGFTIVELLIVIVVIGILAAITVVAYNGLSARAEYSKMRTDFATIKKALELYKVDNGRYPNSETCDNVSANYAYGWCGYNQGDGNSFIPGLTPTYLKSIPNRDPSLPVRDSYAYRASDTTTGAADGGGTYYMLMRMKDSGLSSAELQNNPDLWVGNGYDGIAWGYKSNPALPNW